MNIHNVSFVLSAAEESAFLRDGKPQIVFAGKSNVGKSSVINRLLLRKNFARVGEAPGKTVHVNYFDLDGKLYLVDLPGYGYAKVSAAEKERWAKLMERYFREKERISLGIMIVDARHKPTENDITMADYFLASDRPFLILANKLDKCKKSEIEGNLSRIRETLSLPGSVKVIPFSAEKGDGREALLAEILRFAE